MDELEELKKSILEAFEETLPDHEEEYLTDIFLQLDEEISENTKDDDSVDFTDITQSIIEIQTTSGNS